MPTVNDIFHVFYGVNLELNSLDEVDPIVGIPFVSRSSKNNGVAAYVAPIKGLDPLPAGTISVAGGGSVMESFLQPYPYYSGRDLYVLAPKMEMTDEQKLFYCMCLRANKYRYNYGRQANRTLRAIDIPSLDNLPAWVQTTTNDLTQAKGKLVDQDAQSLDTASWKEFRLGDIFEIKKGSRITKAGQRPGARPFIGAIDSNNGLSAYIDAEALHSAGTITVNYNGNGVAEAFFQPSDYWCSDDVNVLYALDGNRIKDTVGMFIAAVIRKEKYRFSYGRKWGLERMKISTIKLPARPASSQKQEHAWEPDWEAMDEYIRRLPYSTNLGC